MRIRIPALFASLLMASAAAAQTQTPAPATTQDESAFHAELRREGERLREKCSSFSFTSIGGCAIAVATDHPLHLAFGSLAPQNGMGFGPALVMHYTPNENWRLNWNADVAGAISGAWRAGAYLKIVRTTVSAPVVSSSGASTGGIHPYPVIDAYAQTISLPKIGYFGLGPDSRREDKSFFGMRETIVGASTKIPVAAETAAARLNLSLLGEINSRLVSIRSANESGAPSIEQLYSNVTAPGLADQPAFVQFGEGIRLNPSLANGRLHLNYLTRFQQFVGADAGYSFRRWTLDLDHEVPLSKTRVRAALDTNPPDDCSSGGTAADCPSPSRNRTGTVHVRMLLSRSGTSSSAVVPFYFQQTLGGSDINGNNGLPSFEDYRFRGPHVLLFRESLEHSIGDWPVGIWLATDQGRVSLQDDDRGAGAFRRSFGAGLTLRAGGFPAVLVSYATGGSEGHHISFTISASVLGGSSRPSLY